jgi:hypothetical protein
MWGGRGANLWHLCLISLQFKCNFKLVVLSKNIALFLLFLGKREGKVPHYSRTCKRGRWGEDSRACRSLEDLRSQRISNLPTNKTENHYTFGSKASLNLQWLAVSIGISDALMVATLRELVGQSIKDGSATVEVCIKEPDMYVATGLVWQV